jgi:hypothetical protein
MKRLLFLVAVVAIMLMPAISLAGSGSGSVYPSIFSSTVEYHTVYTGESFSLYVNSTYGFNNYSALLLFSGNNLTGISPGTSLNITKDSSPYMQFNITAPSCAEDLNVLLETSAEAGSNIVSYSTTFTIQVVDPINLSATISNPTQYTLHNVTVTFAINGVNVSTQVISSLAPYASTVVNTKTPDRYLLSNGNNAVNVYVNTPVVTIKGATSTFYYGTPPNYTWIYYVAAVVIAFMLFLVFGASRRVPQIRRPKWRKKQ